MDVSMALTTVHMLSCHLALFEQYRPLFEVPEKTATETNWPQLDLLALQQVKMQQHEAQILVCYCTLSTKYRA